MNFVGTWVKDQISRDFYESFLCAIGSKLRRKVEESWGNDCFIENHIRTKWLHDRREP